VIRSMTGFGSASAMVDNRRFSVELRSLNNKYLKCSIRLPEELQSLEGEMEALLRGRLRRGSVTVTASVEGGEVIASGEIDPAALQRYIEQARRAPAVASGEAKLDAGMLLGLPGVLTPPSDEPERMDRARATILRLTDEACDRLEAMRDREGAALIEALHADRRAIAERLASLKELAPGVVAAYEQRLRSRIDALLRDAGAQAQPAELAREIAAYAERTDIAEEISRLGAHIEQFGEMLSTNDSTPIGRTLDFLAQEMLREANTIASKSPDAQISRHVVGVKGAIDRIKEQVQNVL